MSDGKTKKNEKKLLWKIHHWAGLYAGIVIGVLSLTGALAMFIPEIDTLILKHKYDAASTPYTGDPQFAKTVDSLTTRFPEYSSLSINLPEKPGQVALVDLIVRPANAPLERYSIFVDAGKDEIVGERNQQNSLANYMRQIHVRLYEGNWGRQLVGLGGVALVVLAVTGLLIYGNFMKKKSWPNVRKNVGMRIAMADWHKLLGISALAFNLVIALTGAWLGLQPWLMKWLDFKAPNAYAYEAPVVIKPEADRAQTIEWTKVYSAMRKEFPDLRPNDISLSTNGSNAVIIRGNIPGLVYERNINMLALSKTDYTPIMKYDVRTAPFSHKFYFVQEALHFGDFGGLGLKIIYSILGVASGFLSISGFAIYLYRRQKKVPSASNPMKVTFAYFTVIILFLVLVALVSLFIGYSLASTIAAYVINGILIGLPIYAWVRYITKQVKRRRSIQTAA
jgi:uncharacterized iron-regulated membrane protein